MGIDGIDAVRNNLRSIGQDQVLRFYDSLPPAGQGRLLGQLQALDLASIADLAEHYVRAEPRIELPRDIRPVKTMPRRPREAAHINLYKEAQERGGQLLAEGAVAAFLVAGGQGSRLGYEGPKGEYPVTPIRRKPLFQVFAEQLINHGRAAGRAIPWYIMTSEANDAATRAFFEKHAFFGLSRGDVFFFPQGMMPAFAMDGKMLLAEKDSLALSPDGHGGALRALHKSGATADMIRRGVRHLSYFQVDNPLVHCVDPLFIGLHDLTASEMSSKTVTKSHPLEKVGNFVVGDGRTQVIEYSDLPRDLAMACAPDGRPLFNAGSIAIHALRVDFIERLNASGRLDIPWHRAEKKVPYVDDAGNPVKPESPNAVKLEQFVFDAIPLAQSALVQETDRAEEFSPVKNAEGADSPATCRRDQIRRAARWLADAGVTVPRKDSEPDVVLEISPLFAAAGEEVKSKLHTPLNLTAGQSVYLE